MAKIKNCMIKIKFVCDLCNHIKYVNAKYIAENGNPYCTGKWDWDGSGKKSPAKTK